MRVLPKLVCVATLGVAAAMLLAAPPTSGRPRVLTEAEMWLRHGGGQLVDYKCGYNTNCGLPPNQTDPGNCQASQCTSSQFACLNCSEWEVDLGTTEDCAQPASGWTCITSEEKHICKKHYLCNWDAGRNPKCARNTNVESTVENPNKCESCK